MSQKEQRKADRHTLSLNTEVHYREPELHGMFRCQTENIGLRGAFLASAALPLESGSAVELVLNAESVPTEEQFRLMAQVVRVAERGVGLAFDDMPAGQQQALQHFLLQARGGRTH